MKHKHWFVAILALVAASIWVVAEKPIKQGLDLKGGMRVILRANPPEGTKMTPGLLNDAKNVVQRRVDATGVAEPLVQTKGSDQIVVELPDIPKDQKDEALKRFQTEAMLRFVKIPDKYQVVHGEPPTFLDKVTQKEVDAAQVVKEGEVIVTGAELLPGKARGNIGGDGQSIVELHFNADGRKKFADYTMRNVKKYFGIFLDDEPISVPIVEEPIPSGDGVIRGSFSLEEAQDLANLLNAGALPVPLTIEQTSDVGPTLGKESVNASFLAGAIGLGLVALYMLLYYRLPGLVAVIALGFYTLFTLALFKIIPVTLTLPGIAGFILSIGMAVDANILIFERLKEELNAGKTLRAAIDAGFHRAFPSILDSNVCTVITCAILWNIGTGPIRGFALTLALGVIVSMFTAVTCTRTMLYLLVPTNLSQNAKLWGLGTSWLHPGEGRVYSIMSRRKLWFSISGAVILVGLVFMGLLFKSTGAPLNPGIDFTGGSLMQIRYETQVPTAEAVRQVLARFDRGDSHVTISRDDKQVAIRGKFFDRDQQRATAERQRIEKALTEATGKFQIEAFEDIGPTMGRELTWAAIKAVILASLLIIGYLWIRFSGLDFGATAVAALIHDVLVLLGFFAAAGYLLKWEVDSLFVTAALTVVGYSVHDTIVIYDRIREHLRLRQRGESFDLVADRSITQTLARSINTSGTLLVVLVPLVIFGGKTIQQFNVALLVGVLAGTYSSIFAASPLLTMWRSWERKKAQAAAKRTEEKPMVAAAASRAPKAPATRPQPKPKAALPAAGGDGAGDAEVAVAEEATAATVARATKVGPKPQRNIKKKKRRF